MRPVGRGYYQVADLLSGKVDLEMVARCNDAIDLEVENERRYANALRNKKK